MLAAFAAAALMIGLAGCSAQGDGVARSVKVSGDFGSTPDVTFDTPLKADDVQKNVVITGDADKISKDDTVSVRFALYNGTDGSAYTDDSGWQQTMSLDFSQYDPALGAALDGVPLHSRVVVTSSAAKLFGSDALNGSSMDPTQPLVAVFDLVDQAVTDDQPTRDDFTDADFPAVTFDAQGVPTIAAAQGNPPSETKVKVLTPGSGAQVTAADSVTVHYEGVKWRDGQHFDGNFGSDPTSFALTGVITGFQKALVGQQVGSTVLAVMPPSDAYGSASGSALQHEALIFVVKIESTAPATAQ
nr:FKBP-type peptidyl-prolyl cis-trans isomerase [Pseudoclavibacter sp. 13-3]